MKKKAVYLFTILLLMAFCSFAQNSPAKVIAITLEDNIHSVTAEFIINAIEKADKEKAELFILRLNTPGGLDQAMRSIIKKMLNCRTPVVVFVGPSGARAASAGFFILMASDIAVMASGTNTGAAHPVSAIPFVKIENEMAEKVVNDAVAYLKSIADKRGRNTKLAEEAIRKSRSFIDKEALQEGLIDYICQNEEEIISRLNNKSIMKFNGEEIRLYLDNYRIERLELTLRQRILSAISQPFVTFILLALALIGLYYEISNPGLIFPGVIGGICLVLVFFAFQILPVNFVGLLLIALAIIFFILEVKITSYGMLTVAGIISLILGSMMLIKSPYPAMRIPLMAIIPIAIAVGLITTFLLRLVIIAHTKPVSTGAAGLLHEIGITRSKIDPEGKVFVHGEFWKAVSKEKLPKGVKVKIIGVKGLALEVEKLKKEQ
jgi:membrane-bound serine protease (ClpP class)